MTDEERKRLRELAEATVADHVYVDVRKDDLLALLDDRDELHKAYVHACSENLAFNIKVAGEINEARSQRDAALRELERWRHGNTIEGDFVCPNELGAVNARAEVGLLREALTEAVGVIDDWEDCQTKEQHRNAIDFIEQTLWPSGVSRRRYHGAAR